ncbi:MAG: thermonuclease family protein [Candidatus Methylomirabilales bacterium]
MGIDAPEIPHGSKAGQPDGEEARDYLDPLIGGKVVHVDADAPDRDKPRDARTGGQPGLVRWSPQGGSVALAELLIYHKRPRRP